MTENSSESVKGKQSRLLDKAARKYLKQERLYLKGLLFIGFPAFVFIVSFWSLNYFSTYLGPWPPENGIHEQQKAELRDQVVNSQLGMTGGLPIQQSNTQKSKGNNHQPEPSDAKTPLEYLSSSRDLAAQEGVWRASWLISIIAVIQTIIGLIGLMLIAATFAATRGALNEAIKTTKHASFATEAANRAADQSKIATEIELQPYLRFEYVTCMTYAIFGYEVEVVNPAGSSERTEIEPLREAEGSRGIAVNVKIINEGSSPATNVFIDCDGTRSQIGYESGSMESECFRSAESRPSDSQDFVIPANGHMLATLYFAEEMIIPVDREPKLFNADKGVFYIAYVKIAGIEVRYKDFSTVDTIGHKLISGSLTYSKTLEDAGVEPSSASVSWQEPCIDSDHDHFKTYKPIIKS